jgi:hypothetical protein
MTLGRWFYRAETSCGSGASLMSSHPVIIALMSDNGVWPVVVV